MTLTTKRHKPDYRLKATLLSSAPCQWSAMELYRIFKRLDYTLSNGCMPSKSLERDLIGLCIGKGDKQPLFPDLRPADFSFELFHELHSRLKDICEPYAAELLRISNADYERNKRLHRRILDILAVGEKPCFVTFTFNDQAFDRLNPDSRRQAVRRYLSDHCHLYVANVDFGEKNGREHYHAVCDCSPTAAWDTDLHNGFISVEPIRLKDATPVRLAKYVSKLTNHAIKVTTRRTAIIYSR